MNVLTIENISKSYGEKILFANTNLTINNTDKIGLIGVNGTGKSTFLKVISGIESSESGNISYMKGIRIEYLAQNPDYDSEATILEQVFKGTSEEMSVIRAYEQTIESIEERPNDSLLQDKLLKLSTKMKDLELWDYESQVKTILTRLGIKNFNKKMGHLSGGQRKRVALASALITPCDLLILDEPTNHMDNSTIDWLEKYLKSRKGALLMITHDRYFLDRVVNKTIELDKGTLYTYTGNYTEFIEKKLERQALQETLEKKRMSLFKKELEWIRTGARARSTKQKARIQRFEEVKNSKIEIDDSNIDISVASTRLGKKIIEMNHISKSFGDHQVIKDFSYIVLRDDRIGIIGDNGMGKSTLLNLINNRLLQDKGVIEIGSTVKIAYFSQESEDMDESLRAIDYIKETAEFVTTAEGHYISASQLMETFLFTSEMQWTYINRLSGGERRRLYLLKILMEEPNVLILDEPTNDLDIDTLKVLENYIDNFQGVVITVSHDRYFLDRTCTRIFSFEGQGKIIENTGNYSEYLLRKENEIPIIKEKTKTKKENNTPKRSITKKPKLTYKEQREYEAIDGVIEKLENKLIELEELIANNASDYTKLQELTEENEKVEEELLYQLERQEYLATIHEQGKK